MWIKKEDFVCSNKDTLQTQNMVQGTSTNDRTPKYASRRRPALPKSSINTHNELHNLYKAKISAIESLMQHADREHNMAEELFELKKKQEEEKVEQEKIKTKLLLLELKKAECSTYVV